MLPGAKDFAQYEWPKLSVVNAEVINEIKVIGGLPDEENGGLCDAETGGAGCPLYYGSRVLD